MSLLNPQDCKESPHGMKQPFFLHVAVVVIAYLSPLFPSPPPPPTSPALPSNSAKQSNEFCEKEYGEPVQKPTTAEKKKTKNKKPKREKQKNKSKKTREKKYAEPRTRQRASLIGPSRRKRRIREGSLNFDMVLTGYRMLP